MWSATTSTAAPNWSGSLTLGPQAGIDLSGTTDTTVSVARNFVTTELLGSNDLKDAPLQKDGLLYRNKVTLDIRQASPILGDLANYRAGVQRGASERLASGGSLRLLAGDSVVAFMIYELHRTRLHVLNFAVRRSHRRFSVGTQMMEKLATKLSAERRDRILLEVRERNLPAQLFFRSLGYRAISVLKDFYEDTTEDA